MRENKKRKCNIPIFIPHRGCPNACAFCNQKKITGVETDITPDAARELIKKSLETIGEGDAEAAFFGGSFTGLDFELQKKFLAAANEFYPKISGIRLSTRADYIDEKIVDMLCEYNVTAVELGVQSTDPDVLEKNLRGHGFEDVKKAAELIKGKDIELGLQMMIGMYGSTPGKDIKTAEDIISLKPQTTRIYPTVTLKGTKLEEYYKNGLYKPYSLEEAVEVSKEVYKRFENAGVTVLRIGLHSSEELEDGSVVAGPYHPAFGELVFSRLCRDEIEKEIVGGGIRNCEYMVYAKPSEVSKIIGQKRCNAEYFKEKYNVSLKVCPETERKDC